MLTNTFLHLRGIGKVREAELWRKGYLTWDDLAKRDRLSQQTADQLDLSSSRLASRDARHFADALPPSDRWRVYPDFASDAAFLDIETTGLSTDDSVVTLVGILDSSGYTAFVRGDNLDELPATLSKYRLMVTFNGASFDLPFLRNVFGPELDAQAGHIDLRHVLRRAGLPGSLKAIERRTGTGRPSVLATLSGRDAVTLWQMSQEGEPGALPTLIRYNAEDVASLPRLAQLAIERLSEGTPLAAAQLPAIVHDRVSRLPYDKSLVKYLAAKSAYRR